MAPSGDEEGVRALLFERLAGAASGSDTTPFILYDGQPGRRIEDSIAAELERLFNTRVPVDADTLEARPRRTAIDYGIPDLSLFPPRDPDAETRLARHLEQTIAAFEPRLDSPKVTLVRPPDRLDTLVARVDGVLAVSAERRPLTFTLQLSGRVGDGA